MSVITEKVFEAVKALSDEQAAEVLSFVEGLKASLEAGQQAKRERALAVLSKYRGLFKVEKLRRDELRDHGQHSTAQITTPTQRIDWSLFRQHRGAYDGSKIDREALHDRSLR